LAQHSANRFDELALADSSRRALALAADVIGPGAKRYQVDVRRLQWSRRWNVAFLLDVLEHIPDDVEVLRQIRESLRPEGLLFVTAPALNVFWSYNDTIACHIRRYSRADFQRLALETGFELVLSRYFMFFLSPLLLLSRWKSPNLGRMSAKQIREHARRTHRVPWSPVNLGLSLIFAAETPLGNWLSFPWGTSVLAVLRRRG
jgi:SAM-dependent methyltransferase